jgi:mRNA interferase RelE/StbE
LKGYEGEALRVRVGDYRVIYKVDDVVRIVAVVRIGHRREVYK